MLDGRELLSRKPAEPRTPLEALVIEFLTSNKLFQFLAVIISVTAAAAHSASIAGVSASATLLYGLPIGYLLAEIWVSSLMHGETKQWTWLPVLRGRLRKQKA